MPDVAYYNWNLINNHAAAQLGFPTSPPLKSEVMNNYEWNAHLIISSKVHCDMNIFYNYFKDQLSWGNLTGIWTPEEIEGILAVTEGVDGMFQNLGGEETAWGSEFILNYWDAKYGACSISYSYASVGEELIQRTPLHILKLNYQTSSLNDRVNLAFNYVYHCPMDNLKNPPEDAWHESYLQSNHQLDLSVSFDVTHSVQFYTSAHNVLESEFPPITFQPDKPFFAHLGSEERKWYFGIRVNL